MMIGEPVSQYQINLRGKIYLESLSFRDDGAGLRMT